MGKRQFFQNEPKLRNFPRNIDIYGLMGEPEIFKTISVNVLYPDMLTLSDILTKKSFFKVISK